MYYCGLGTLQPKTQFKIKGSAKSHPYLRENNDTLSQLRMHPFSDILTAILCLPPLVESKWIIAM